VAVTGQDTWRLVEINRVRQLQLVFQGFQGQERDLRSPFGTYLQLSSTGGQLRLFFALDDPDSAQRVYFEIEKAR
jgi:hypothetical protein